MKDPYAPLVVALTHTGFSIAKPVPRSVWAPLFERLPSSVEELRQRVYGSANPEMQGALGSLSAIEEELHRLDENGVRAVTLFDDRYPTTWSKRLGLKGPPILFAIGDSELIREPAVAILGSRDAPERALAFADSCARQASRRGWAVVSGGARGVDFAALHGACQSGGDAIVVAADTLHDSHRKLLKSGCDPDRFVVLTVNHPDSGFSVGQAMARNKLVYGLANVAVIASCEEGSGGTWAGATEAIRAKQIPICVWTGPGAPAGCFALQKLGAIPVVRESEVFEARLERTTTLFEP